MKWEGLKVEVWTGDLSYDSLFEVERDDGFPLGALGGLCKVVIVFVYGGIFYLWTTWVSIVILKGYVGIWELNIFWLFYEALYVILDWADTCLERDGSMKEFYIALFNKIFWYF